MPLKLYKNEDENTLTIGRVLYAKRFGLTVDKELCKGCDVCVAVCPREAITLKPVEKDLDGTARASIIDIDLQKCDYHGECSATCPFGAIKVTVNGKKCLPVVEKECYPELIREIVIESEKCEPECKLCEEECPLDAIKVRFEPVSTEDTGADEVEGEPSKRTMRTIVDVNKDICACCKVCEAVCPVQVIKVSKFLNGSIEINQDRCPEGCHDCLDVCPVEALYLDEDGKVYVNDSFCIYCKACVNVCPEPEALKIVRTSVRHTPVKSGAWNKALEKLTSVEGARREFEAKRLVKVKEALKNLQL